MVSTTLIAAMGINGVIGKDGALPWRIPSESRHFKEATLGHVCIIGRVSYETLKCPLFGRDQVVLTKNQEYADRYAAGDLPRNVYPAKNMDVALNLASSLSAARQKTKIMIIGGACVYKECLPSAKEIILTVVHSTPAGDRFFPQMNQKEWSLYSCKTFEAVGTDECGYSVLVLKRTYRFG